MRHHEIPLTVGALPSYKNRCPRSGCGRELTLSMLDSGVMEESCPELHYSVRTVTGESRLNWAEATRRFPISLRWAR